MGDGRFVCVVSPTFRNRRCGSGAVTMAAGVSYVGCCSGGVLPVTGGGLFLRANYKRSTTWYSPLGKPARPDLIVCVSFSCAFRVAAHNSNANTNSSVRYARLLACRSVDVVSFFLTVMTVLLTRRMPYTLHAYTSNGRLRRILSPHAFITSDAIPFKPTTWLLQCFVDT